MHKTFRHFASWQRATSAAVRKLHVCISAPVIPTRHHHKPTGRTQANRKSGANKARLTERKGKFNLSVKADAALAPIAVSLVASLRARFLSYREERLAPLLLGRSIAYLIAPKSTSAVHLFLLSPLVQCVQANFVLAALSQITGLSAPECCCILLVALAPAGTVFRWQLFTAYRVLPPVYSPC